MIEQLSFEETRVIGALIEKEITTSDQYPLSLNALTNACNQKSNREPVVNFDESQVQQILDGLHKKRLIMEQTGYGSRVPKYKHRFANTEFSELQLSDQELAIITVMLLRGPQTPGELRSRTNRLCSFNDVHEVERVLETLANRSDGPYVVKLPREAGKRESRFAHLFSGDVDVTPSTVADKEPQRVTDNERINMLEARIEALEQRLAALE